MTDRKLSQFNWINYIKFDFSRKSVETDNIQEFQKMSQFYPMLVLYYYYYWCSIEIYITNKTQRMKSQFMHCLPIEEDHRRSNHTNIQSNWKVNCYFCLSYFIPFHSLIHLFVIFHSISLIGTFVCYISCLSLIHLFVIFHFIPSIDTFVCNI